jgi:hypothetical protein
MTALDPAVETAPVQTAADPTFTADPADCTALDGQCVEHEDDFGDHIHSGEYHALAIGDETDLLPICLKKWNDGRPYIVLGWGCAELDVAAADAAISALAAHLAHFREQRDHLATAIEHWAANGGTR